MYSLKRLEDGTELNGNLKLWINLNDEDYKIEEDIKEGLQLYLIHNDKGWLTTPVLDIIFNQEGMTVFTTNHGTYRLVNIPVI